MSQLRAGFRFFKKKKIIISQSDNDKQHKDERATDRDQLKLTRPWLLSMT